MTASSTVSIASQTVAEPVVMLQAAGASIAVRRKGKGPPIVCTHAIGHGARDFEALASRLGHMFEFIMLDWPGQGSSPADDGEVSSQRYSAILMDVLDQLSLSRVILLGNSIGGGASIITAATQADRVRGLVLCNTAGLVKPSLITRLFCRNKARFFEQAERGVQDFPAQFRRYYEKAVLPGHPAKQRREEIIATATAVGPIIRRAWLSFAKPESDLRALALRIKCPVLIAWAKDDKVNRWAFSKAAAKAFPNRRIEMLPGGHAAFLEAPAAFDAVFHNWLRSIPT